MPSGINIGGLVSLVVAAEVSDTTAAEQWPEVCIENIDSKRVIRQLQLLCGLLRSITQTGIYVRMAVKNGVKIRTPGDWLRLRTFFKRLPETGFPAGAIGVTLP
jgi:hypothetical protein